MQKTDGDPNQNPTKPERPPQLKKFRTINTNTNTNTASSSTSQFPAVNRIASLPPLSSSSSSHRILSSFGTDSFELGNGDMSDRDWHFPSFLGPHPGRTRTTVKVSKPKSKPKPKLDVSTLPASSPPSDFGSSVLQEKRNKVVVEQKQKQEDAELVKIPSMTNSPPPLISSSFVGPNQGKRFYRFQTPRFFNVMFSNSSRKISVFGQWNSPSENAEISICLLPKSRNDFCFLNPSIAFLDPYFWVDFQCCNQTTEIYLLLPILYSIGNS